MFRYAKTLKAHPVHIFIKMLNEYRYITKIWRDNERLAEDFEVRMRASKTERGYV